MQEQKKSKILQESMMKLDAEMKRTDSLLYQMIPKQVADRLRSGEPAISTCEVNTLHGSRFYAIADDKTITLYFAYLFVKNLGIYLFVSLCFVV